MRIAKCWICKETTTSWENCLEVRMEKNTYMELYFHSKCFEHHAGLSFEDFLLSHKRLYEPNSIYFHHWKEFVGL